MKRIICIFVMMIMMASYAIASDGNDFPQLDNLSYDELVMLQREVTKRIMSRPEWKEVKVTTGDWKVGEDIPSGTYSIKCDSSFSMSMVEVWEKEKGDYTGFVSSSVLADDSPIGKIELKDGWTVTITYAVIFTPYVSLGF